MRTIIHLFHSIYVLGWSMGIRYWKIGRYYECFPDDMIQLIDAMRQKHILDPHSGWNLAADMCQKSLDKYKGKM